MSVNSKTCNTYTTATDRSLFKLETSVDKDTHNVEKVKVPTNIIFAVQNTRRRSQ